MLTIYFENDKTQVLLSLQFLQTIKISWVSEWLGSETTISYSLYCWTTFSTKFKQLSSIKQHNIEKT